MEEEDCLLAYTPKKCEKYCSTSHQKGWKCTVYKALKKKRKHKTDEKGRGGYRVLKGSRTVINGSKSSVYRVLRRNEKEKRTKEKRKIRGFKGQQD